MPDLQFVAEKGEQSSLVSIFSRALTGLIQSVPTKEIPGQLASYFLPQGVQGHINSSESNVLFLEKRKRLEVA